MKATRIPPVHPGEVLLEDFLKPLGISLLQPTEFSRFLEVVSNILPVGLT